MYIKFSNIDDFNTWHSSIMNELGIPDELGTIIYSEPIVHPVDGTVVAVIDERATPGDREVVDKEDLYTLGYKEMPSVPYIY